MMCWWVSKLSHHLKSGLVAWLLAYAMLGISLMVYGKRFLKCAVISLKSNVEIRHIGFIYAYRFLQPRQLPTMGKIKRIHCGSFMPVIFNEGDIFICLLSAFYSSNNAIILIWFSSWYVEVSFFANYRISVSFAVKTNQKTSAAFIHAIFFRKRCWLSAPWSHQIIITSQQ